MGDWSKINKKLNECLSVESLTVHVTTEEKFVLKVDEVVHIINKVLEKELEVTKPSPFSCHWWTSELSDIKKAQNRVGNKTHKLHLILGHLIHAEFKVAANKFKEVIIDTRNQNWIDWLKAASQWDLYITNKYIMSEPTNYSNAHVLTLCTTIGSLPSSTENGVAKAAVLAESFFPPPSTSFQVPQNAIYLEPLKGICFFSHARIC
jgi:hypothetical protein